MSILLVFLVTPICLSQRFFPLGSSLDICQTFTLLTLDAKLTDSWASPPFLFPRSPCSPLSSPYVWFLFELFAAHSRRQRCSPRAFSQSSGKRPNSGFIFYTRKGSLPVLHPSVSVLRLRFLKAITRGLLSSRFGIRLKGAISDNFNEQLGFKEDPVPGGGPSLRIVLNRLPVSVLWNLHRLGAVPSI